MLFVVAFVDFHVPGLCELANDDQSHLDSALVAEQAGRQNSTILGEGPRQDMGIFEAGEVVTTCDHLGEFPGRKSEYKAAAESNPMSLHLLIELLGACPVKQSQIPVQYDALTANFEYWALDGSDPHADN